MAPAPKQRKRIVGPLSVWRPRASEPVTLPTRAPRQEAPAHGAFPCRLDFFQQQPAIRGGHGRQPHLDAALAWLGGSRRSAGGRGGFSRRLPAHGDDRAGPGVESAHAVGQCGGRLREIQPSLFFLEHRRVGGIGLVLRPGLELGR